MDISEYKVKYITDITTEPRQFILKPVTLSFLYAFTPHVKLQLKGKNPADKGAVSSLLLPLPSESRQRWMSWFCHGRGSCQGLLYGGGFWRPVTYLRQLKYAVLQSWCFPLPPSLHTAEDHICSIQQNQDIKHNLRVMIAIQITDRNSQKTENWDQL